MKIIVLGLGQSLRGDDAAGLEAVRFWQARHPESAARVRVELSELPGLDLLDLLSGIDAAILVDAIQSSQPAGTLIHLSPEDLAGFTPDSNSAHGWGVAETLQLGRSLVPYMADCQVTLIGIVGKDFSLGGGLSPGVRASLNQAADMLESEIRQLI